MKHIFLYFSLFQSYSFLSLSFPGFYFPSSFSVFLCISTTFSFSFCPFPCLSSTFFLSFILLIWLSLIILCLSSTFLLLSACLPLYSPYSSIYLSRYVLLLVLLSTWPFLCSLSFNFLSAFSFYFSVIFSCLFFFLDFVLFPTSFNFPGL